MVEQGKLEESELTPKVKEQVSIQALVALLAYGTSSTQILYKLSTYAIPLQISVLSPSSSKAKKLIHYGDVILDEEIVITKYDYDTMTIEKIGILQ